MDWILEHLDELGVILLALHSVAVVVVNITDTPKDNEALGKVYKIIEGFAGIVTSKVKKVPTSE